MTNHQADSEMYGGKAASLIAQYEAGNTDFLFPFTLIDPDKEKPTFDFEGLQIVRGSAAGDEKGLVDVIKTIQNVSSKDLNCEIDIDLPRRENWRSNYINSMMDFHKIRSVRNSMSYITYTDDEMRRLLIALGKGTLSPIDEIIKDSKRDEVVSFAKWEGNIDYNGVKSVIISPQNIDERRGQIIEHPNMEGHYIINVVNAVVKDTSDMRRDRIYMDEILADSSGNIVKFGINSVGEKTSPKEVKAIVEMKRRAKEVGFISGSKSSQVEFGFFNKAQKLESKKYQYAAKPKSPIIFYQEREFRPFDFDDQFNPQKYVFNRFGRIPQEGLELRVVVVEESMDRSLLNDGVPSIYTPGASKGIVGESYLDVGLALMADLNFRPENMHAYLVPMNTKNGSSLEHGNFRWASKAPISLLKLRIGDRSYSDDYRTGEMIMLTPDLRISNSSTSSQISPHDALSLALVQLTDSHNELKKSLSRMGDTPLDDLYLPSPDKI